MAFLLRRYYLCLEKECGRPFEQIWIPFTQGFGWNWGDQYMWKIYDNDDYEDNDDYDDEKLINYDLKWAKNGSQMLWFQMGTWI